MINPGLLIVAKLGFSNGFAPLNFDNICTIQYYLSIASKSIPLLHRDLWMEKVWL